MKNGLCRRRWKHYTNVLLRRARVYEQADIRTIAYSLRYSLDRKPNIEYNILSHICVHNSAKILSSLSEILNKEEEE